MSNYNNKVHIAVFWLLYRGFSQKSHTSALGCSSPRYVICSACVSVLSMWVCLGCVPVLAAWSPILLCVLAAAGHLPATGTGKCVSIPSDMHHNFIYSSIPGFVSIALASFLHLWNSCLVQWRKGFDNYTWTFQEISPLFDVIIVSAFAAPHATVS